MSLDRWVRTKSDEAAVDAGCVFDLEAADRVRRFLAKYVRHSKGAFSGKPFELLDWQWNDYVAPLFGWKMPNGTRRFRNSKMFVPKKNGKSTLLAGLSLYLLCSDGEAGAEVYSAAADRRQASIIYNEAANMVEASKLRKLLKVRKSRKYIGYPGRKSTYEALSADANTKEGLNIHALLFDEIHAIPDSTLWDTLKYGGAARTQPLFLMISTAGIWDETLFWWDQWQAAKGIIDGSKIDISTHAVIYAAGERDDWTSEDTWRKANPSYGLTLNTRSFTEEAEQAKVNAADESTFKRYRLNVPVKSTTGWVRPEFWDACKLDEEPDLSESRCIASLDLAAVTDLNAFVTAHLLPDYLYIRPHFWCPELKVQEREKSNRQRFTRWVADGWIRETPTAYTDYSVIHDDIVPILRANNARELAIDDWNFTQLAVDLRKTLKKQSIRCTIVPVRTGFKTISPATKELTRLILSRSIRFLANPVLDWMFGNMVIEMDASGNQKPDKSRAPDKIDGIVAIILALARFLAAEEKPVSKYETQGLRFMKLGVC